MLVHLEMMFFWRFPSIVTPVISVEDDADGVAHLDFFHCIDHIYFCWFVKWIDIYKMSDNVCHFLQNRRYHDCHKDRGNGESNACHREFKPRGGDHPCFRPLCSCSCPLVLCVLICLFGGQSLNENQEEEVIRFEKICQDHSYQRQMQRREKA